VVEGDTILVRQGRLNAAEEVKKSVKSTSLIAWLSQVVAPQNFGGSMNVACRALKPEKRW
jgi:hypothetical protein